MESRGSIPEVDTKTCFKKMSSFFCTEFRCFAMKNEIQPLPGCRKVGAVKFHSYFIEEIVSTMFYVMVELFIERVWLGNLVEAAYNIVMYDGDFEKVTKCADFICGVHFGGMAQVNKFQLHNALTYTTLKQSQISKIRFRSGSYRIVLDERKITNVREKFYLRNQIYMLYNIAGNIWQTLRDCKMDSKRVAKNKQYNDQCMEMYETWVRIRSHPAIQMERTPLLINKCFEPTTRYEPPTDIPFAGIHTNKNVFVEGQPKEFKISVSLDELIPGFPSSTDIVRHLSMKKI